MNLKTSLLVSAFAMTLAGGSVQAASFTNSTGLAGPHLTETFDAVSSAGYPLAGTQFSGMTFGPNMYVNGDYFSVPGFSGPNSITNFYPPLLGVIPTTLTFSAPVTSAAFALFTNPTTPSASTFIASLGSTPVEVFSSATCFPALLGCPATPQFVNFTGITFDRITFVPTGTADKIGIDNVQYVLAAVPEPETYAMMLAGLGLMGFVARRRKQRSEGVVA